jgi:hypothetical protein
MNDLGPIYPHAGRHERLGSEQGRTDSPVNAQVHIALGFQSVQQLGNVPRDACPSPIRSEFAAIHGHPEEGLFQPAAQPM